MADLVVQPKEISHLVRRLRLSKGLTVRELARKSGVDPSFISRLERGEREWTVETLHRVATGLGEKIVVLTG